MTASWDICIRGGGIVGRTLALLLAQQANRVALVERPGGPGPDVRAYALNETSRQLLSQMGCWPPPSQATPVQSMQVWGDAGGHVRFDAPGPLGLTTIVDVPALESLLDQALTQRPQVTRVSEPVSASLTVICEGRHSTTRAELGIDVERVPYQQHALACRVQTEHPHRQQALQWFRQEGATPEVLALLPLDGPAGSQSAVIWSTSPERAQQLLALSETDFVFQLQAASQGYLGQLACSSARADRNIRMVGVTSSTQGEGKSTAVTIFAGTLADLGLTVLVVDADMRLPMQSRYVGIEQGDGLSSLLSDSSLSARALIQTVSDNFDILPSGPKPPDPARLLNSHRCQEVVDEVRGLSGYDIVLWDAPPCLMLADPILLGEKLDGILFLVGLGKVNRDLAPQACRRLKATGVDVLGLICNQVTFPSRLNDYGYEYGYYYHYAYAGTYANSRYANWRYANSGLGLKGYLNRRRESYLLGEGSEGQQGSGTYISHRYRRDGQTMQAYLPDDSGNSRKRRSPGRRSAWQRALGWMGERLPGSGHRR